MASRFVTTPSAAISGAWRATSSSRKPSASTTPITSGVFAASAALEVVVLGGRAADQCAGGKGRRAAGRSCRPKPALDGSLGGPPVTSAVPPPPALRGHDTEAMPASAAERPSAAGGVRSAGRDDLERAGRARAEGVPGPARSRAREPSSSGTTLIDGMPVSSPQHRQRSATRATRAIGAEQAAGGATAARPSAREARRAVLAASAPRAAASLSTRGPSLASTAGSSVSVAASTKTTESMIPSAIDRNAGLGTSITADSEISTVSAGEQHRLAGGVHRLARPRRSADELGRRTRRGSG